MKTKISPSLIGLFVLGALLLAGVGLVAFGNVSIFSRPERFVVFFDESVHGLDPGSAVKLRGVRVGRVADIRVRYDVVKKHSEIEVICELSRSTMVDASGQTASVADGAGLQKLVDAGLRSRLGISGLATGLLFVDLDFFNPGQYPARRSGFADDTYVVVPAIRSTIAEFQASLFEILAKLKDVDIVALSREATGLITDARRQLNTLDLPQLVNESTQTVKAVRLLASDPGWNAALTNLNGAVTDLRTVIAHLDAQVTPTGDKLAEILTQAKSAVNAFNATALTVREFITAQQGLGGDADVALRRLAEAADSVRRLAEFLERNPAALITGKVSSEPATPPPPAPGPARRKP